MSKAHCNDISREWVPTGKISSQSSNELSFTFFSPDYPWTADELNILNNAIDDFYPIIEMIYGEPAFPITVNVRKDPSIIFSGEYSPRTKEIVLRDATQLDVLCHEMIHAFRDENMILINSFEEGMARAVEVEVFSRLTAYTFWNEHHSYMYDVYYEGLNRQLIGSQSGNFDYASPFLLLRYDLSGYAWAKVFLENSNFFADFNSELYDRVLSDRSTLANVSMLKELAASIQPVAEGKPFLAWYEQQGIFDPTPWEGYFLYQNISNFNVYYFLRDTSGFEKMIEGATIDWEIYDHEERFISSGSGVTSRLGWISLNPSLPVDYKGRIKIVSSVLTPDGLITNTVFTAAGNNNGIFGIVEGTDSGVITIMPLDGNTSPITVDVAHGIFDAPSLASEQGRFIAVYSDDNGQIFSKQFNKDASDYFLSMVKSSSVADLSLLQSAMPDEVTVGSNLMYTLTITNNGPDMASEVLLTDVLPPGVTFVSAIPTQGRCTFFSSSVRCAMNALDRDASATVNITVTPVQTGAIHNNANVTGNVSDPDVNNNSVLLSSSIIDIEPAIKKVNLLINKVATLVGREILNRGQAESLTALLEAAEQHIERDRANPAINQIRAFIAHVTAFVRAGIISQLDEEELKSAAYTIIAMLTQQHQALSP